ncbi:MAG: hypothetical protein WBL93_03805 [Lutisporaceae bacterium]
MAKTRNLDDRFLEDIVKLIDSNNLNFLIGSGFSADTLKTLGNLEKVMEIIKKEPANLKYRLLESLLYWHFFEISVYPMVREISINKLSKNIEFINIWKQIITKRENPNFQKQLNIFTTNYDVVLEYSMENSFADYNDGFAGRINPYFTTANYNKVYYKQALFSNRRSELPIFNLFKLHGSITWKKTDKYEDKFAYGDYIEELEKFYDEYKHLIYNADTENGERYNPIFTGIDKCKWDKITKVFIDTLIEHLEITPEELEDKWIPFIDEYKTIFKIVNPTKEKFSDTLVDKNYYELLRIYCNELERENALLFVYGFSFNDEHIEDITKRALNNPSLIMIIFAFTNKEKIRFIDKFAVNNNVWVIGLAEWDTESIEGGVVIVRNDGNADMPEQEATTGEVDVIEQVAITIETIDPTQTIAEPKMDINILNTFFGKLIQKV